MTKIYANLKRIFSTNKGTLASELDAKMFGGESNTKCLGIKFPDNSVEYYTPEGGDAKYNSLELAGLAGSGEKALSVDNDGNVQWYTAPESTVFDVDVGLIDPSSSSISGSSDNVHEALQGLVSGVLTNQESIANSANVSMRIDQVAPMPLSSTPVLWDFATTTQSNITDTLSADDVANSVAFHDVGIRYAGSPVMYVTKTNDATMNITIEVRNCASGAVIRTYPVVCDGKKNTSLPVNFDVLPYDNTVEDLSICYYVYADDNRLQIDTLSVVYTTNGSGGAVNPSIGDKNLNMSQGNGTFALSPVSVDVDGDVVVDGLVKSTATDAEVESADDTVLPHKGFNDDRYQQLSTLATSAPSGLTTGEWYSVATFKGSSSSVIDVELIHNDSANGRNYCRLIGDVGVYSGGACLKLVSNYPTSTGNLFSEVRVCRAGSSTTTYLQVKVNKASGNSLTILFHDSSATSRDYEMVDFVIEDGTHTNVEAEVDLTLRGATSELSNAKIESATDSVLLTKGAGDNRYTSSTADEAQILISNDTEDAVGDELYYGGVATVKSDTGLSGSNSIAIPITFGSGDFDISFDLWVSSLNPSYVFDNLTNIDGFGIQLYTGSTYRIVYSNGAGLSTLANVGTAIANQWQTIRLLKSGTDITLFVDSTSSAFTLVNYTNTHTTVYAGGYRSSRQAYFRNLQIDGHSYVRDADYAKSTVPDYTGGGADATFNGTSGWSRDVGEKSLRAYSEVYSSATNAQIESATDNVLLTKGAGNEKYSTTTANQILMSDGNGNNVASSMMVETNGDIYIGWKDWTSTTVTLPNVTGTWEFYGWFGVFGGTSSISFNPDTAGYLDEFYYKETRIEPTGITDSPTVGSHTIDDFGGSTFVKFTVTRQFGYSGQWHFSGSTAGYNSSNGGSVNREYNCRLGVDGDLILTYVNTGSSRRGIKYRKIR